jgi:hypothetical protein
MSGPATPPTGGAGPGQQPPGAYPMQHLSEQRIEPGRSRTPIVVAVVVAIVLVAAGVVAYFAVSPGGGGGNRAAYCAELGKATHGGRLSQVVTGGGTASDPLAEIARLRKLAPSSVSGHWAHLSRVAAQAQTGKVPADALGLLNDVSAIRADAKSACNLDIGL